MSRHRQFFARREDANPHVGAVLLRRQDKGRLGKVHLLRDGLHLAGREPAAVEKHGELVACKGLCGEDVEMKIPV